MDGRGPDGETAREMAGERLMAASRVLMAVVAGTLRGVDDTVTVPQLRVLVMLWQAEPMNLNAIARGLAVNPSNASRTCDKLEAARLVVRSADADDRRHLSLSLTPGGRRLVEGLMAERAAMLDAVLARVAPEAQRALAAGLEAFLAAALEQGLDPGADGGEAVIGWLR